MRKQLNLFRRTKFFIGNEIRRFKLQTRLKNTPAINFIWIPKNAGTSIFNELHDKASMVRLKRPWEVSTFPNTGSVTFGHYQYAALLHSGIISEEYHNKSWKFCITRCPYERAISLHKYLTKGKSAKKISFDEFLKHLHLHGQQPGFYHVFGFSQAAPQSKWMYLPNGNRCFNQSYDLNDLESLERDLSEQYNLNIQFPQLNKSNRKSKTSSLSRAQIELINLIYKEDFEHLQYPMI